MGLPLPAPDLAPTATRRDLQLGRRLFHLANGVAIASAYALLFTHQQVVHVFGTIACLVYIVDRVRIHYPEAGRARAVAEPPLLPRRGAVQGIGDDPVRDRRSC